MMSLSVPPLSKGTMSLNVLESKDEINVCETNKGN
jgi:hypothetical protein